MKVRVHVSMQVEGVLECEVTDLGDEHIAMQPLSVELGPVHQRYRAVTDFAANGGKRPEWADNTDLTTSMVQIAAKKIAEALASQLNQKVAEDENAEFVDNMWASPAGGAKA